MNTKEQKVNGYILFDLIGDCLVYIPAKGVKNRCQELGIDYTIISKLNKVPTRHINHRFVPLNVLSETFYVYNIDTKEKYRCITNKTLFLHLNVPYNDNEAKYVYELKAGRQRFATISNNVFCINLDYSKKRIKPFTSSEILISVNSEKRKQHQFKTSIQSQISVCVKKKDSNSGDNIIAKYCSCTQSFLKRYLESKFSIGMNWGNYGFRGWHIDHITPATHFNLRDINEAKKAFHYTNLQPIWSTTKKAIEMGESIEYVGNLNKNSSESNLEYHSMNLLKEYLIEEGCCDNPQKHAEFISAYLFKNGVRKVY